MTARDTVALSTLTERVGDSERDGLMSELNGHHAHGRLSSDELDRRLGLALTAVTRYDLLVLVADLPASDGPLRPARSGRSAPDPARLARRRELRRALTRRSAGAAVLAAPLVGAGLFIGDVTKYDQGVDGGFWATVIGGAIGFATYAARDWASARRRDRG